MSGGVLGRLLTALLELKAKEASSHNRGHRGNRVLAVLAVVDAPDQHCRYSQAVSQRG